MGCVPRNLGSMKSLASAKTRKRVLLVEPAYNNPYPPLGLLKISTWHKKKGDEVQLVKDIRYDEEIDRFEKNRRCYKKLKDHYDIIYITSLFTYQASFVTSSIRYYKERFPNARLRVGGIMATLIPDLIKRNTGVDPHVGLLRGAENCPPDYSWYPNLPYSITFTTRGCPRNCDFCGVARHEPEFKTKDNWMQDIDITKRKIIFWDNNWLASPNLKKDIKRLVELRQIGVSQVDFNQGLDCKLIDEKKMNLLSRIRIDPLRMAFDNCSQDGYVQNAIRLAQKHGFKDVAVYVLYNFEGAYDTPDYFYYRINEINRLGALAYPMRYRPIDTANGIYVSENWGKELLRGLKLTLMFFYTKGMITKSRESFMRIYGKNAAEFKARLYDIYQKDRLR